MKQQQRRDGNPTPSGPGDVRAQFAWVTVGRLVSAGCQAALLALTAVWLGPSDFGALSAVYGLALIVQTVTDFGASTYVTVLSASPAGNGKVASALRFNSWASMIVATTAVGMLFGLGITISENYLKYLPLALWVGIEKNVEVRMGITLADGRARLNATLLLVRRCTALALLWCLFKLFAIDPVVSYGLALAISALLANGLARWQVKPPTMVSQISIVSLMKEMRPYWVHTLATQLRNADVLLTASFAGAHQAGLYSVASRLTNPLRIVPTSLAAVLVPRISANGGRAGRSIRLLIASALGLMLVVALAVALAAPIGLTFVLGEQYEGAVPAVQAISLALVFGASASLLAGVLQGKGLQRWVAAVSSITSVYCLPAIAIAAAHWGAVGAALALSSSFACQTGLMAAVLVFRHRRRIKTKGLNRYPREEIG